MPSTYTDWSTGSSRRSGDVAQLCILGSQILNWDLNLEYTKIVLNSTNPLSSEWQNLLSVLDKKW